MAGGWAQFAGADPLIINALDARTKAELKSLAKSEHETPRIMFRDPLKGVGLWMFFAGYFFDSDIAYRHTDPVQMLLENYDPRELASYYRKLPAPDQTYFMAKLTVELVDCE